MQRINYTVNNIVSEYKRQKRYKNRTIEMQEFQKQNCAKCKNKYSDKCNITRNLDNKLSCIFNEQ